MDLYTVKEDTFLTVSLQAFELLLNFLFVFLKFSLLGGNESLVSHQEVVQNVFGVILSYKGFVIKFT